MILDLNGMLRESYSYGVYGEENKEERFQPFGFTGYQRAGNLSYANARYYDVENGRFVSEDKHTGYLENPMNLHKYLYCYQNPLGFVDLDGNVPTEIAKSKNIFQILYDRVKNEEAPISWGDWTTSLGYAINGAYGLAGGFTVTYVFDSRGNIAKQYTVERGAGFPGISIVLVPSWTNAPTYSGLNEYGGVVGGSAGAGIVVGGDILMIPNAGKRGYMGVDAVVGVGISPCALEFHGVVSETKTMWTFNIFTGEIMLYNKKIHNDIAEKLFGGCEEK